MMQNPIRTLLTFFVTRAKTNTKFRRLYSQPVDKSTGLICDQTISRYLHYNHCKTIQKSLAGRAVFQMDQTTSQNQKILRHICERSKISDMDCRLSLCACGNFEKKLHLQESLYTILQILSVTIFEKDSIYQLITERDNTDDVAPVSKQLKLYN